MDEEAWADRLVLERDFFRSLLDLPEQADPRQILEKALSLAVGATGSKHGYLEISDERGTVWEVAKGVTADSLELIRGRISRGIIAESLATGEVVHTPSALIDDRFQNLESVRGAAIEAVYCTPIGADAPFGVLYLEAAERRGLYPPEDTQLIETFAHHVSRVARTLLFAAGNRSDSTVEWRRKIDAQHLVGRSPALARVLQQVTLVAPLEVPVLLTGASGTGKTMVARTIHENSPRKGGPFLEVNCATLRPELIESELFGYVKGAFTNADANRPGKVAAAEGGTLFLDEIGEFEPQAQAKLLQLLQSGEYYPVGGTQLRTSNVRVICATNADLKAKVKAGTFREDLYYRINVFPVVLPALSQRVEDVETLSRHFVETLAEENRMPVLRLAPSALMALERDPWTGNIRELRSVILQGLIRAVGAGAPEIHARHLYETHEEEAAKPETFHEATHRFQKAFILRALEEAEWNVAAASRRIDIARSHLYNLMKAHAIRPPNA